MNNIYDRLSRTSLLKKLILCSDFKKNERKHEEDQK